MKIIIFFLLMNLIVFSGYNIRTIKGDIELIKSLSKHEGVFFCSKSTRNYLILSQTLSDITECSNESDQIILSNGMHIPIISINNAIPCMDNFYSGGGYKVVLNQCDSVIRVIPLQ